jgi:ribonuclease P protein component
LTRRNASDVRSREIKRILDARRPLHGERVVMFLEPGSGRAAVIAGKRIGGAVQRNRARRVLRAAWIEVAPRVGAHDAVLVAMSGIQGAKAHELVGEMTELASGVVDR